MKRYILTPEQMSEKDIHKNIRLRAYQRQNHIGESPSSTPYIPRAPKRSHKKGALARRRAGAK